MKNVILSLVFLGMVFMAFGQEEYLQSGIRLGIHQTVPQSQLAVYPNDALGGIDSFKLSTTRSRLGGSVGFWARFVLPPTYFQPEILFSVTNASYNVIDYRPTDAPLTTINDTIDRYIYHLEVPLSLGVKIGFLHAQAGLVPSISLSKGPLDEIETYQRFQDAVVLNYRLGRGVDIGRITIDAFFERSFWDNLEIVEVEDVSYRVDQFPTRLMLSLGIDISKRESRR